MALGSVIIQEKFEESPRLTYRARSREAFGSNLEVFAEEPTLTGEDGAAARPSSAGVRDRRSTTGSSPRDISPQSPGENGESVCAYILMYPLKNLTRIAGQLSLV